MIEIPLLLMPVIVLVVVIALGIFVVLTAGGPHKPRHKPDLVELDEAAWRDVMKDDSDILKRRFASRQDLTRLVARSTLEARAAGGETKGAPGNTAAR